MHKLPQRSPTHKGQRASKHSGTWAVVLSPGDGWEVTPRECPPVSQNLPSLEGAFPKIRPSALWPSSFHLSQTELLSLEEGLFELGCI